MMVSALILMPRKVFLKIQKTGRLLRSSAAICTTISSACREAWARSRRESCGGIRCQVHNQLLLWVLYRQLLREIRFFRPRRSRKRRVWVSHPSGRVVADLVGRGASADCAQARACAFATFPLTAYYSTCFVLPLEPFSNRSRARGSKSHTANPFVSLK